MSGGACISSDTETLIRRIKKTHGTKSERGVQSENVFSIGFNVFPGNFAQDRMDVAHQESGCRSSSVLRGLSDTVRYLAPALHCSSIADGAGEFQNFFQGFAN